MYITNFTSILIPESTPACVNSTLCNLREDKKKLNKNKEEEKNFFHSLSSSQSQLVNFYIDSQIISKESEVKSLQEYKVKCCEHAE